ncbi:MAG TPA: ABC transporter permease [Gaiellaceae bacterium]|nr:ABC transporter permease [Gaiellaceae bacterium]
MITFGYALRRLGASVLMLLVLTLLTFALYRAIPANPAGFLVDLSPGHVPKPAEIARARKALGVDRPLWEQYGLYLWRVAHGDLGIAFEGTRAVPLSNERTGQAVGPAVVHAAMVTGSVVVGGALFALLLSVPLGAIAASRPRSLTDRTILVVSLIGICTHPLVVALLLQQFPGRRWGLAPPGNYCPFFGTSQPGPFDFSAVTRAVSCGGPTAWASHLILPWITFALFFLAIYTRLVRVRMIEVMDEPFIRTAAAKGASRSRVVRHHALRNAMSPVLTLVGMDIGLALGIALYIESVYRLPGLGLTTLGALSGGAGYDLPMILGVVLVIGVVIIAVNFAIDLAVLWMDPRAAQGGTRRSAVGRIA